MTECLDAMPENYARRQEVIDQFNAITQAHGLLKDPA
jgi:hypothetical protein